LGPKGETGNNICWNLKPDKKKRSVESKKIKDLWMKERERERDNVLKWWECNPGITR